MKKLLLSLLLLVTCAVAGARVSAAVSRAAAEPLSDRTAAAEPLLLPRPASVEPGKGLFRMSAATPFVAETPAQAELLRSFAAVALGYLPEVATDAPRAASVRFSTDAAFPDEGYRLEIGRAHV